MLAKGCVKVLLYRDGTSPDDPEIDYKIKLTKFMNEGVEFGELALLYNEKRSATITAVDYCETYNLERDIFKDIVIMSNI